MKPVLIVQNTEAEGPGLIKEVLEELGLKYDVVLATDKLVYPAPSHLSHVIVLGGPDSANDETEKIRRELAFVSNCIKQEVPYLGICLGMQVLLKAAGAEVHPNYYEGQHYKEIGFEINPGNYNFVRLTRDGIKDPIFEGLPNILSVFHLHGETAELGNATLLANGKYCTNQAVRVGRNAYGTQFHLEMTREGIDHLLGVDSDLMQKPRASVLASFDRIASVYTENGTNFIRNFLNESIGSK